VKEIVLSSSLWLFIVW